MRPGRGLRPSVNEDDTTTPCALATCEATIRTAQNSMCQCVYLMATWLAGALAIAGDRGVAFDRKRTT